MLSPELLNKVKALFISSRYKVTDLFVGEYESAFRGRGIEFEDFREYMPGDDVRQIDWNVSARFDKPFIKTFKEEREKTIFFVVDLSGSQDFGRHKRKRDIVSQVAALLSFAAMKSNDKVGLILFSDQVELYRPAKKGRGHVWSLISNLLSYQPKGKGTRIENAVNFFMRVQKRKSTCFLITDFLDDNYQKSLKVCARKHDLVAIRVLDELEKSIQAKALTQFRDLETGQMVSVDLRRVQLQFNSHQKQLKEFLSQYGIDLLDLNAQDDFVERLMQFFLKRESVR